MTLDDVFGVDEAKTASTLIEAIKDEAAKAVKGTINARKVIGEEKSDEEREKLAKRSELATSRAHGHQVTCPSCDCIALLHGSSAGTESSGYKDGLIVTRQPMLPSSFECTACG